MAQLACRGARLSAESQDVLVAKICELTGHRSDRVARDYAGREALEYRRSHLVASLVAAASSHPEMRPVPDDISIDRLDHAIDSLQPEHIFRALDHGVADDAQEEAAEVQRQAAAAADPGIDEPPRVLTEDPPAVMAPASRLWQPQPIRFGLLSSGAVLQRLDGEFVSGFGVEIVANEASNWLHNVVKVEIRLANFLLEIIAA